MRRPLTLLVAAALLIGVPASARAAIDHGPVSYLRAQAAAAAPEDVLHTAEGYAIGMSLAQEYAGEAAREQSVLTTLDGLLHGSELAYLHVIIETPQKVADDCGSPDAVACYGDDTIVLPGEQVAGGPPLPFLLAHEYAHHILAHRRNDPWFASDWGSKGWASAVRVCPAVRTGQLFLGYWTIPAEAYAESYATMLFPAKNSVGTAQIKNGAVTTAKLAPAASARIAGLTYRSTTITADPHMGGVIAVPCPAGMTAIGGGVETAHTLDAYLLDSHPTNGRSWEVSVGNSADVAEQITAWAVCAKVEGGAPKAAASAARMTHQFRLPR